MRVEKVVSNNKEQYILVGSGGEIIQPVIKYLNFKESCGYASSSLKARCQHLKLYFTFLSKLDLDYKNVDIDKMANFLVWLHNFCDNSNGTLAQVNKLKYRPATICTIFFIVLDFYEYIANYEDCSIELSKFRNKNTVDGRRAIKDFIYQIDKNQQYQGKGLNLKNSQLQQKTITKEQADVMVNLCVNIRDKLLIQLLWETKMQISEALALWLEDFEIEARRVHVRDRGILMNQTNNQMICSSRSIDVSPELISSFIEYVSKYHKESVSTQHAFIILRGENKGKLLRHNDVYGLFNSLKKKARMEYISPNKLRNIR